MKFVLFFITFFIFVSMGFSQSLVLNWIDNSDNESGFKIERSIDGVVFNEITKTGIDVVTHIDNNILSGITYYYKVRAFNLAGNSGYTNIAFGKYEEIQDYMPTAPQNLTYVIVIDSTPPPSTTFPLMSGLSFAAIDGQIQIPFIINGGLVYQTSSSSSPSNGGLAGYTFNVTVAGNYKILCEVDGPSGNSDSFYVGMDSEPTNSDIFDILPSPTSGIESRYINIRGNGSFDNPQYFEKIYTLSTGYHDLYVRGRESNAKIKNISIVFID